MAGSRGGADCCEPARTRVSVSRQREGIDLHLDRFADFEIAYIFVRNGVLCLGPIRGRN
jgi:hypothetical protein